MRQRKEQERVGILERKAVRTIPLQHEFMRPDLSPSIAASEEVGHCELLKALSPYLGGQGGQGRAVLSHMPQRGVPGAERGPQVPGAI